MNLSQNEIYFLLGIATFIGATTLGLLCMLLWAWLYRAIRLQFTDKVYNTAHKVLTTEGLIEVPPVSEKPASLAGNA
jgi:hypothetical protein